MVSVEGSMSRLDSRRFPPVVGSGNTAVIRGSKIPRHVGRSMRTIRARFIETDTAAREVDEFDDGDSCYFSTYASDNLSESLIDEHLGELAAATLSNSGIGNSMPHSPSSCYEGEEFLGSFSGSISCCDISGELQRLACIPSPEVPEYAVSPCAEPCAGFLQRDHFSTEIIDSISPEDLQPTVAICVDALCSRFIPVQRSAAAKLRFLAKNRSDNRLLIAESGAVPALVPLLRSSDPLTQEHAVTAVLNLSLHDSNKASIVNAGAVKALVYALKTGTEVSKQNSACALLSLAMVEENKVSIGVSGAIPPLVALLISGSTRGKKDALTTLYKLCSNRQNKEKTVAAGAVGPLVGMVADQGTGMAEKAMVVLSSLAAIVQGREAIVEEGGIATLVEVVEDGSSKGKEFAVLTLLQLCCDDAMNRALLVREGAIPPLVALSQCGTVRAKQKAEALLGFLRESRQEVSNSSL